MNFIPLIFAKLIANKRNIRTLSERIEKVLATA
jgi:hypothetical protein